MYLKSTNIYFSRSRILYLEFVSWLKTIHHIMMIKWLTTALKWLTVPLRKQLSLTCCNKVWNTLVSWYSSPADSSIHERLWPWSWTLSPSAGYQARQLARSQDQGEAISHAGESVTLTDSRPLPAPPSTIMILKNLFFERLVIHIIEFTNCDVANYLNNFVLGKRGNRKIIFHLWTNFPFHLLLVRSHKSSYFGLFVR